MVILDVTMTTEINGQNRSDAEFGKAFSNKRRLEILRLLSNESMSVKEIAHKLSLNPANVRHHIRTLARSELIEEVGEKHLKFGRPTTLYRATQTAVSLEFPKRRYGMLSEILLQALIQSLSTARVAKTLKEMGYRIGEDIVNELALHHGIRRWDTHLLKQYFVEEYLGELGSEPEVIRVDDKELVYRTYNCVFAEVSHKYPELICNSLDMGMREGVLERSLGFAEFTRTKCKGHGDQYCEFIFRLKPPETESTSNNPVKTVS